MKRYFKSSLICRLLQLAIQNTVLCSRTKFSLFMSKKFSYFIIEFSRNYWYWVELFLIISERRHPGSWRGWSSRPQESRLQREEHGHHLGRRWSEVVGPPPDNLRTGPERGLWKEYEVSAIFCVISNKSQSLASRNWLAIRTSVFSYSIKLNCHWYMCVQSFFVF